MRRQIRASAARLGRPAPPGVARCRLGVGRCWSLRCGVPFLCVRPRARRCALSLCATAPGLSPSPPAGGFVPCLCGRLPATFGLSSPPCQGVLSLPSPFPCPCPFHSRCGGGGVGGGPAGRRWCMPGAGWSGATGGGLRGCGGGGRTWTTSRRRAFHAACGMASSGAALLGLAGVPVQISSKVCTMCTPSRLTAPPAHFTQQRSSCKAGADHQARWAGAWGGEGFELKVLERRWQGLGVEDAYGRRGERESRCCSWREEDVDMGRPWRAWRRPGERERRWRGPGWADAYGRRGEREARCCSWGEGYVVMGRRCRAWRRPAEREGRWQGLAMEDAYGRRGEREARCCSWGEGDADMGRRWRAWQRLGERERQEPGPRGAGVVRVSG